MKLEFKLLNETAHSYGDSFYILDTVQFRKNFTELRDEFRKFYPNSNIAYSYKTNYIPRLCKIVDELGGFAEVVSDMEYELALRIGVDPHRIMFNGPYKSPKAVEKLLLSGGCINLDSLEEIKILENIIKENPQKKLRVGIRCNFPVGDGVVSRFGFDTEGEDFVKAVSFLTDNKSIIFAGIHCHFASRVLDYWTNRVTGAIDIFDKIGGSSMEYIDLGGGIFGKMADSLKAQFSSYIPSYKEYAQSVAKKVAESFKGLPNPPCLFIEPGSALSGDVMKFAAKVISIKQIGTKSIATLLGSIYNINPTLNTKNPPLEVYHCSNEAKHYENLDFGGFTCIESDYLYKGFSGKLAVGDYVVFGNVGSYSVVLKPPFILPNFAVVDLDESPKRTLVKEPECFDDIFHTYKFN